MAQYRNEEEARREEKKIVAREERDALRMLAHARRRGDDPRFSPGERYAMRLRHVCRVAEDDPTLADHDLPITLTHLSKLMRRNTEEHPLAPTEAIPTLRRWLHTFGVRVMASEYGDCVVRDGAWGRLVSFEPITVEFAEGTRVEILGTVAAVPSRTPSVSPERRVEVALIERAEARKADLVRVLRALHLRSTRARSVPLMNVSLALESSPLWRGVTNRGLAREMRFYHGLDVHVGGGGTRVWKNAVFLQFIKPQRMAVVE